MNERTKKQSRGGQSLIEILVGVGALTIFVVGAVLVFSNVLRTGTANREIQTAVQLGQELLDNVRSLAGADWDALYSLDKGSDNHYYLDTSGSPFAAQAGDEDDIDISGTTFTRYFYVEDVCREAGGGGTPGVGNVTATTASTCSVGAEDPSTQKVTIIVVDPTTGTRTLSAFLTRSANAVLEQGSWRGGDVGDSVSTRSTTTFSSGSNIDYSTSSGALQLQNP